jgi:hypothetical protein
MVMTMKTARVKRERRAVSKGPGQGRKPRIGRGKRRQLRTERGKGWGRGRETVNGKVLINPPQEVMISLVALLCSCRSKCRWQTWTRRAN